MLKRFSSSSVFSPSKQREMGLFHREKNHKGVEIFKSPHPSFISFYSFPLLIFHFFFIYFSSPRSLTNYSHLYFSPILLLASVLPFLHHLSLLLSISSFFLYISTFPSCLFTFSSSPPFIRPSPPSSSPPLSLSPDECRWLLARPRRPLLFLLCSNNRAGGMEPFPACCFND